MTAGGGGDDWSQPELVRSIKSLTRAMERFEESVDVMFRDLDRKYVPREVYDRDMQLLRDRHASSETWLRDLLAPLVTGLIVAVAMWLIVGHHP